jgi:hypothetical protein
VTGGFSYPEARALHETRARPRPIPPIPVRHPARRHRLGTRPFFQNSITFIGPSATTALSAIGNSVTSVGTISHPNPSEAFGYMANIASAASANTTAGTGTASTLWLRGGLGGGGFFFATRAAFPDAGYNETGAGTGTASTPKSHYLHYFVGLPRRITHPSLSLTRTGAYLQLKDPIHHSRHLAGAHLEARKRSAASATIQLREPRVWQSEYHAGGLNWKTTSVEPGGT